MGPWYLALCIVFTVGGVGMRALGCRRRVTKVAIALRMVCTAFENQEVARRPHHRPIKARTPAFLVRAFALQEFAKHMGMVRRLAFTELTRQAEHVGAVVNRAASTLGARLCMHAMHGMHKYFKIDTTTK